MAKKYHCHSCPATFDSAKAVNNHAPHCRSTPRTNRSSIAQLSNLGRLLKKPKIARRIGDGDVRQEREDLREVLNEPIAMPAADVEDYSAEAGPSNVDGLADAPSVQPVSKRSGRKRKIPKTYVDYVPSGFRRLAPTSDLALLIPPEPPHPPPLPPPPDQPVSCNPGADSENMPRSLAPPPSQSDRTTPYQTCPDDFGLFREYSTKPLSDTTARATPANFIVDSTVISIGSVGNTPARGSLAGIGKAISETAKHWFAPFTNPTAFWMTWWQYSGSSQKSSAETDRLSELARKPDFALDDMQAYSSDREHRLLDNYHEPSGVFSAADGWQETSVKIRLPKENIKYPSEADAPEFEVKGLWYRRLHEVIRSAFEDDSQLDFEMRPFKLIHQDPANPELNERIFTDIYNSDALLEEQATIDAQPRNPDDNEDTEYVTAPIMLWSDSTHLTSFGSASLWPIYMYFGGLSKYIRGKVSSFASHHLAYIPKLPDTLQDAYRKIYDVPASSDVMRFCRAQLLQGVWLHLLDNDFMHAYEHGMLVKCGDGLIRRIFPRFLTYSADYPERVALTCIRFLARCPCPTCLTEKAHIAAMGSKRDIARRRTERKDTAEDQRSIDRGRGWIFTLGYKMKSKAIERLLEAKSLQPIRSAFSVRLSPFNRNFYSMFVPDVMHEFELGVWKATFTHILRVLRAAATENLAKLNSRFRRVPTFGRSTIRAFGSNVSGMKKLAARDFEDILQSAAPCIEGLLPEPLNRIVLDLLWEMASWHALAKLRLHTESTLKVLDSVTTTMGNKTRKFAKALEDSGLEVYELPNEEVVRTRRAAMSNAKGKGKATTIKTTAKRKYLNLSTFKWHNCGHVAAAIRRFGTADGFTTQTGELEHRRPKKLYPRCRKRPSQQIARNIRRERILNSIHKRESARRARMASRSDSDAPRSPDQQAQVRKRGRPRKSTFLLKDNSTSPIPFHIHHHIAKTYCASFNMLSWANANKTDPATRDFLSLLKAHLIGRLTGEDYTGDEREYSTTERFDLQVQDNRIYEHRVLQVNYTTYDMRRDQDSINPRSHPDIMVLSHEDEGDDETHPYWYARVVGIYHANVRYLGPGSTTSSDYQRVDFLWIRWFGRDMTSVSGFAARRLPRVGFLDTDSPGAFGFLNPEVVIRGVHVIPAFHHGRTSELLRGPSIARQHYIDDDDPTTQAETDWQFFYVNIFVDRDMFMRYLGGGIGHKSLYELVKISDTLQTLGISRSRSPDLDSDMNSDSDEEPESTEPRNFHDTLTTDAQASIIGQSHNEIIPDHDLADNEDEDYEGGADGETLDEEVEAEMQDFGYLWGNGADYEVGGDSEPAKNTNDRVFGDTLDGSDQGEDSEEEFDDASSEGELDEDPTDLGFEEF